MSQSREDLFIAAALTGLLSAFPYGRNDAIAREIAYKAIDIGKHVAKATEPFQPPAKKESDNA